MNNRSDFRAKIRSEDVFHPNLLIFAVRRSFWTRHLGFLVLRQRKSAIGLGLAVSVLIPPKIHKVPAEAEPCLSTNRLASVI